MPFRPCWVCFVLVLYFLSRPGYVLEMLVSMAFGTVLELVSYMIPQFYNHGVEKNQNKVSSCMAGISDHFILDELVAVECKLCRLPTPGSASGCRV